MRNRTTVRRGRRTASATCWVLLATGLTAMAASRSATIPQMPLASAVAASRFDPAPLEVPSDALMPPPSSSEHPLGASSSSSGAQRPPATSKTAEPTSSEVVISADRRPSKLSIPVIDVSSTVDPLGLNADGSLEVPARGPSYDHAGWFTGSPSPGESGPAVLLGHVNGRGGVPSVFFRLAELQAGDLVSVDKFDGSQSVFEVYRIEQYPKDQFPTTTVYGDTAGPELRLITCAGAWDAEVSHYRDNTVVYARGLPTG